ncbi:ArsC family reductase [Proteobacteria bacterium 005FR1]|nr:ArsC family reductase [Proteobacteria bacterium 005FR1]
MITLYGIPNCDTVAKARRWLEQRGVDYRFHDFRKEGLSEAQVKAWIDDLGVDTVVNKRSTSWKNLSPAQRETLDEQTAVQLILDNPTLIKRPLLENGKQRVVGFKEDMYLSFFA